jgi:hypothetical protein
MKEGSHKGALPETDLEGIYLAAFERDNPNARLDLDVYILNLSDSPRTLELCQASFQGDLDGLLDLGHSRYKTVVIQPKAFLKIDHFDDDGQLDFTTAYNIRVGDDQYFDQINGWSFSKDRLVDIPVLDARGYLGGFSKAGRD